MCRKLFVASETIIIKCDEMNIIGVSFFIAHNLFDKCHTESLWLLFWGAFQLSPLSFTYA